MGAYDAIKVAIDLIHVPSRVRWQQCQPLPDGVAVLLRIAAGDENALSDASRAIDRSPELLRRAAAFFVEQILLCRAADSYRVLGASQTATAAELRRNMALLFRCVHPDANWQDDQSVFAGRVTQAWEDLKTTERRAAYDKGRQAQDVKPRLRTRRGARPHFKSRGSKRSYDIWESERRGLLRRTISLLLGRTRHP